MTLRVVVEIIPHGDEERKHVLTHLDISNIGLLRNEGFGHDICEYKVTEWSRPTSDSPYISQEIEPHAWEGCTHDRRDGFWGLIKEVLKANVKNY